VSDRLYRSPTDRVIAGVAGGLAVWLNIDPSIVRIAWVLLAVFSGGIFVLVYIVMMIVVPLPPPGWIPQRAGSGAPGGWGGWSQGGWSQGGWSQPGWPPASGGSEAPGGPPGPPGSATGAAPGTRPAGWTGPDASPTSGWLPPADGSWASPPPPSPGWVSPFGGHNGGIVLGGILIVLGLWFLVARYVRVDWAVVWPVVVIALGVGLIVGAIRRNRPGSSG
jgi:phage shock protein C